MEPGHRQERWQYRYFRTPALTGKGPGPAGHQQHKCSQQGRMEIGVNARLILRILHAETDHINLL